MPTVRDAIRAVRWLGRLGGRGFDDGGVGVGGGSSEGEDECDGGEQVADDGGVEDGDRANGVEGGGGDAHAGEGGDGGDGGVDAEDASSEGVGDGALEEGLGADCPCHGGRSGEQEHEHGDGQVLEVGHAEPDERHGEGGSRHEAAFREPRAVASDDDAAEDASEPSCGEHGTESDFSGMEHIADEDDESSEDQAVADGEQRRCGEDGDEQSVCADECQALGEFGEHGASRGGGFVVG